MVKRNIQLSTSMNQKTNLLGWLVVDPTGPVRQIGAIVAVGAVRAISAASTIEAVVTIAAVRTIVTIAAVCTINVCHWPHDKPCQFKR